MIDEYKGAVKLVNSYIAPLLITVAI